MKSPCHLAQTSFAMSRCTHPALRDNLNIDKSNLAPVVHSPSGIKTESTRSSSNRWTEI